MKKIKEPKIRISCYKCKDPIKDTEDYIQQVEVRRKGKIIFNYHESCFVEQLKSILSEVKERSERPTVYPEDILPTMAPSACEKCDKPIKESYIMLRWIGKTWSAENSFHAVCSESKQFIEELISAKKGQGLKCP